MSALVLLIDRIHEVQMRYGWERRPLRQRRVIGNGRCEAGVPNKLARCFVVEEIVAGSGGEDNIGTKLPKQSSHCASGCVIAENRHVAKTTPAVIGADQRCGFGCLGF